MTAHTLEYATDTEIVARAGRYYRNTRYLMTVVLILMGAWFAYDGWVKWPRQQAMHRQDPKTGVPRTDLDIRFQRVLGFALPAAAVLLLARTLHNSRGEYRLRGETLSVPGHGDVPLSAILKIDKSRWDRKGIAYLEYDTGQRQGRLKLDDFVYERWATDKILERIEERLLPAEAAPAHENEARA